MLIKFYQRTKIFKKFEMFYIFKLKTKHHIKFYNLEHISLIPSNDALDYKYLSAFMTENEVNEVRAKLQERLK